ncbi:MAG: cysteine-rich small domain-containing protein [Anaerovorax sp.]
MEKDWKDKHFSFFSNRECEYFPCHKTNTPERFNCLFCYCPLYALGTECGGDFVYTENGIKNCSACMVPHEKDCYGDILDKLSEMTERK